MTTSRNPFGAFEGLLFLLTASFWGGSFIAIKFLIQEVPPLLSASLRLALAALALRMLYLFTGRSLRVERKALPRVCAIGILSLGLPFALLFWGEQSVAAGTAGIINGTVPIWTLLFSVLFFGGRKDFTRSHGIGLGLGLAGVTSIFYPLLGFGGRSGEEWGLFAVLMMAFSYSLAVLLVRRSRSGPIDLYTALYYQVIASFFVVFPLSLAFEHWSFAGLSGVSWKALVSLLYLGVCSTGIAFLMYYRLIATIGALRSSAITFVVPAVALGLQFVFFGTAPSGAELVGVFLVVTSILFIRRGAA